MYPSHLSTHAEEDQEESRSRGQGRRRKAENTAELEEVMIKYARATDLRDQARRGLTEKEALLLQQQHPKAQQALLLQQQQTLPRKINRAQGAAKAEDPLESRTPGYTRNIKLNNEV